MSRGKGKRQLFVRAPAGTQVYRSYEQGRVRTHEVGGMPLSVWPDGLWCMELAAYMDLQKSKGRSLFDRGGTLGTYASELSHLVRYCYANKVDFHLLTDAHFMMFMRNLAAEKQGDGEQVRRNRTIIRIGRRTLAFLEFAGKRRKIDNYLSPEGPHIRAFRKVFTKILSGNRMVRVEYWHHPCFPEQSEVNRRNPVTEGNINLLRQAASTTSRSSAQKMRRLAILRVLEATGARRSEVANLRVAAVRKAKAMERPFIELMTVKRKRPEIRLVPISHSELDFIIDYIDLYRAPIVTRKLGDDDHGLVFVSITSGRPIVPSTVSLELHILRKAAGIKGKAHAHLFRHRFFTVRVYRFIVAHKVRDAQHFFEFCMKFEHLKIELMQETGIKSAETLQRYVDWAFALGPILEDEPPKPSVDIGRLAREGRAELAELEAERAVLSALEYADRVERALKRHVDELSRADGFNSERTPGNALLARALGITKS